MGPQYYVVQPQDTLETIAKRIYGDSRASEAIAAANDILFSKHALRQTSVLHLPEYVPMFNDYQKATPFDKFKEIMLGSLSPQVIVPQAAQSARRHSHGFFKMLARIIAVALVIAAAVICAPMLLGCSPFLVALSAELPGLGVTNIVAGVLAGLGDAAVQEVAVKFNMQSSISFNEILETAVSAGLTSALGTLDHLPNLPEIAKQSFDIGAATTMTQLVEMEAGTRDRF